MFEYTGVWRRCLHFMLVSVLILGGFRDSLQIYKPSQVASAPLPSAAEASRATAALMQEGLNNGEFVIPQDGIVVLTLEEGNANLIDWQLTSGEAGYVIMAGVDLPVTVFSGYQEAGTIIGWRLSGHELRHDEVYAFTCEFEHWGDPTELPWNFYCGIAQEWIYANIRVDLLPLDPCYADCRFCQHSTACAADPVDTRSGAFLWSELDFTLPALSESLHFERRYNSARYTHTGALGYGWSHNYDFYLERGQWNYTTDTIIFHEPHGSTLTYFALPDGSFSAPPNTRAHLSTGVISGTHILSTTDGLRYTFAADGRLFEIRDKNENILTLTYENDLLVSVFDAQGRGYTLTYTDFSVGPAETLSLLTQVTDPLGRRTEYGYAQDGGYTLPLLNVVTDTRGFTHTFIYTTIYTHGEPEYLLAGATDAAGHILFTNTYGQGYPEFPAAVIAQVDRYGQTTYLDYYESDTGYETHITDALGNVVKHHYSTAGVLTGSVDSYDAPLNLRRDTHINPNRITDALERTTYVTWNEQGCAPQIITDTIGNATHLTYDASGCWLRRQEDARHHVTYYDYDDVGNLISTTNALSQTTYYAYNAYGQLLSTTTAGGETTTYAYDAWGQRTVMTDTAGLVTRYGYDLAGRLITTTSSTGLVTVNAYDDGDSLLRVTRNYTTAGGQNYLGLYNQVTTYTYDRTGRRTHVTDTLGLVTRPWYNAAGQLVGSTRNYSPTLYPGHGPDNAWNFSTWYGYDALGRQTLVTDTLVAVTYTEYDGEGRVLRTTRNHLPGYPQNAYLPPVGGPRGGTTTWSRNTATTPSATKSSSPTRWAV